MIHISVLLACFWVMNTPIENNSPEQIYIHYDPTSGFSYDLIQKHRNALIANNEVDRVAFKTERNDGVLTDGLLLTGTYREICAVQRPHTIVIGADGIIDIIFLSAQYGCGIDYDTVSEFEYFEFVNVLTQDEYNANIAMASERVRMMRQHATQPLENPASGGTDIVFHYPAGEIADEPGHGANSLSIAFALSLAEKVYEDLLKDHHLGQVDILIDWQGPFPTGPIYEQLATARTERVSTTPWSNLHDQAIIGNFVGLDTFDQWESEIYNELPDNRVHFTRTGPGGVDVYETGQVVDYNLVQRLAIFGVPIDTMPIIYINNSVRWDYNPDNGIDADKYDLAGVLVHELGHIFGFISNVDTLASSTGLNNNLHFHDVYRFNRLHDAPEAISAFAMFDETRELRINRPAVTCHELDHDGQLWRPDMSRGRGSSPAQYDNQASHWADEPVSPGYTGVMTPVGRSGESRWNTGGSVLRPNDVRSFDLIGYMIDESSIDYTAQITLDTPVAEPVLDPSVDLTLSWTVTPSTSTNTSSLYIYQINEASPSLPNDTLVYRADNIPGSSHTIYAGDVSLIPGSRYQWHVTSQIPLGLVISDPATFIIQDQPGSSSNSCRPVFESAKIFGHDTGVSDTELGYDVTVENQWAAVGAPALKSSPAGIAGRVEIYKQDGSLWRYHQTVYAPDPTANDWFGASVDISGNRMVIGAPSKRNDVYLQGQAHVFELSNDEWVYKATLIPADITGIAADYFGISCSISEDRVVVGAPYHTNNKGSAYIYEYDSVSDSWSQSRQFVPVEDYPSDSLGSDNFGWSVKLHGERVAIGSYGDSVEDGESGSGSVSVFSHNGGAWISEGKLFRTAAAGANSGDDFGFSVSLHDDSLAVGIIKAYDSTNTRSGLVQVFTWDGFQWTLDGTIDNTDLFTDDNFGYDVSIEDNVLLVGADLANGTDGGAYVYRRLSSGWRSSNELVRTDENGDLTDNGRFGNAIDQDSGTIITGATYSHTISDGAWNYQGTAYIHEISTCPIDLNEDETLDFYDVSAFLTAYGQMDPIADLNCDGIFDYFDVNTFNDAYNQGCP